MGDSGETALIGDDNEIVIGHGRVLAAKELGIAAVPTVELSHLSAEERRAYVLADNELALKAGWDMEILRVEPYQVCEICWLRATLRSHGRDGAAKAVRKPSLAPPPKTDRRKAPETAALLDEVSRTANDL